MRTYRTYTHIYRPGRRGVIKLNSKRHVDRMEDRLHRWLLSACVLTMVVVVAVPHG